MDEIMFSSVVEVLFKTASKCSFHQFNISPRSVSSVPSLAAMGETPDSCGPKLSLCLHRRP